MAGSVGEIGLDLVVNKNEFEKQMSSIQNVAKKAGAALAGAFAVKKLVDFGKGCLELGSDLAEVQNVVDVTFPKMSSQVDKFAKNAVTSFGLSETMAKQFTGTFGAMAKSFGFTESAAYEMSSTLTALAGDVASFYNISQDEAYTKLKSVFSGETETLKDLGVVMTQSALDAYAMANGFGKTTAAMSEAEKVALRYQFVQDKLSAAQGDFARTSGGWANQIRILQLQFDSLKATIGQGLINLFTPILQMINTLFGKLATLANAFKSFTELITGNKSSGSSQISGMGAIAVEAREGLESASEAADGMAASANKAGNAAKKAAEKMKSLMGFDKINKLQKPADDTSKGNSGTGGNTVLGSAVDFGNLADGDTVLDSIDGRFKGLIERCKELAALFGKGFRIGFGDSDKRIQSIQRHIESIGKSLKNIFTDKSVVSAANRMFDTIALNAGKVAGSIASVGITIADNLVGGIDLYLKESSDYIKDRLVSMFDVTADIAGLAGDFSVAFADIFTVFSGDNAKTCTAAIIGMFSDGFLGVTDIALRLGRDIIECIVQPITENKERIKQALENTLAPFSGILTSIHGLVKNTFESLSQIYDENLRPAFESIESGLSTVFAGILDAYNAYLAPVLGWIAERFSVLVDDYVQPLIDAFLDCAAKIIEALSILWDFLSPFVAWFAEKFIAEFASKIQWLWTKFEFVFSAIAAVLQGLLKVLSGVLDFVTGVFTGNWDRAWKGIKEIFQGCLDAIMGVAEATWNLIINIIETATTKIRNGINVAFNGIRAIMSGIWENIKNQVLTSWSAIQKFISDPMGTIKRVVMGSLEAIHGKFTSVFGAMGNIVRAPVNQIIRCMNGMINAVASGVNGIAQMLNSIRIDAPKWVTDITGITSLGFKLPMWTPKNIPYLAQGGFVKANTPRLAMIGDNRHYGEVVAPEDKMQEMVDKAVRAASGTGGISREDLESIVNQAVSRIIAALANMGFYLDGEELARARAMAERSLNIRYNEVTLG